MKCIKNLIICLLCMTCLVPTLPVLAQDDEPYARALNILGLFGGTENGFELRRTPSRAESLVMLIRLMGKEKEALSCSYPNPFTDTSWEEKYVSYGHSNAFINGISNDCFGGTQDTTLKQYCAMLLRALGYTDFTYEDSVSFATLVLGEKLPEDTHFDRGAMAQLSCYALNTRIKNSSLTLGQFLVDKGVFDSQMLIQAQKCWEQEPEYESTTVLIYAVGSDLESQQSRLSNDLQEILRGGTGNNCKVLMQTGGTLTYHNDYMTNGNAERFFVQGNTLQKINAAITTGASKPETLSDFIRWGAAQAPAQRYILVMWDHGYGIKGGFGADELNERKTMKVSEIDSALSKANVYFDIISFDACLMGTAETAFALRNHTKYLIASEDSTPACGLYYTTWLGALESNPAISTRRLGRLILDAFTLHAGIEANIPTTISMMQVSRALPLFETVSELKGRVRLSVDSAKLLGESEGVFDQFDLLGVFKDFPKITAAAHALAFEVRNNPVGEAYSGVAVYVPSRKPQDAPVVEAELKNIGLCDTYLDIIFNGAR